MIVLWILAILWTPALEGDGFMEGGEEQPEGLVRGNADNSYPGDP